MYFASNDIVKKVADTHAQIRYAILFITGKRVFLYSQFHIQYSYFGIKNIRDIKTNSNHARIISKRLLDGRYRDIRVKPFRRVARITLEVETPMCIYATI